MTYQEFLDYIKNNFIDFLLKGDYEPHDEEDVYTIDIHQIMKNNGIKLDGLIVRKNNESLSPNIYLNSYYDSYQFGKPLTYIMEDIARHYRRLKNEQSIEIDDILDFSCVRNQIILRLVNYEKNREVIKNCPYKRFLDLAVTYRYMAKRDEKGLASSLISYDEFSNWNISEEELYQIALFNTMREFPWHMESLASVILDCLKRTMPKEAHVEMEEEFSLLEGAATGGNMYVLSNDSEINGASCILYDSVIKNFARVQDSNVIILPSSIHEVILVPESEDTDIEFLQNLVLDANQSAVGKSDKNTLGFASFGGKAVLTASTIAQAV